MLTVIVCPKNARKAILQKNVQTVHGMNVVVGIQLTEKTSSRNFSQDQSHFNPYQIYRQTTRVIQRTQCRVELFC